MMPLQKEWTSGNEIIRSRDGHLWTEVEPDKWRCVTGGAAFMTREQLRDVLGPVRLFERVALAGVRS